MANQTVRQRIKTHKRFVSIIICPLTARAEITNDFTTSILHFSLFSTVLWDLANSRPVHSLMSSEHFFCLPCLLPPFSVPCKMVLPRPDERKTCSYHCSLRLFSKVRRFSCGVIACWILARTSSLTTRSLYKVRIILRWHLISPYFCGFYSSLELCCEGQ